MTRHIWVRVIHTEIASRPVSVPAHLTEKEIAFFVKAELNKIPPEDRLGKNIHHEWQYLVLSST